jgi:hypothetical protein
MLPGKLAEGALDLVGGSCFGNPEGLVIIAELGGHAYHSYLLPNFPSDNTAEMRESSGLFVAWIAGGGRR